jgi:flagellar FliL protein
MAEEKAEKPGAAEGSDEKAPEQEAAPRRKLPLLIAAAVGALLLVGGGAWWVFLHKAAPAVEASEAGDVEAATGDEQGKLPAPGEVGAMVALDPFIANLSDEDGRRYLKATLQLEFTKSQAPPDFTARLPLVRDLLLTLFSSKTFGEVRTPQGKAVLRDEIVARVNHALRSDVVKAVYFTEFIVQ